MHNLPGDGRPEPLQTCRHVLLKQRTELKHRAAHSAGSCMAMPVQIESNFYLSLCETTGEGSEQGGEGCETWGPSEAILRWASGRRSGLASCFAHHTVHTR